MNNNIIDMQEYILKRDKMKRDEIRRKNVITVLLVALVSGFLSKLIMEIWS
jgi:hypothetical protein